MNALYFPLLEDEQILRLSERQPCQARVSSIQDSRADLIVTDHFGNRHVRLSVPVGRQVEQDYCLLV